jgi:hypothetical protein
VAVFQPDLRARLRELAGEGAGGREVSRRISYAKRQDANQSGENGLQAAFERLGCSVVDLSRVGSGVPDLAVSLHKFTAFVEIKTEEGFLNPLQIRFHQETKATCYVARNLDDVIEIVGRMKKLAFGRLPADD